MVENVTSCFEKVTGLVPAMHCNGPYFQVFPYALKVNLSICCIGTCVGCVHVIFTLSNNLPGGVFGPQAMPASWNQGPLAFVEYLLSFPSSTHNYHGGIYHIKKVWGAGSDKRVPGEIVPLSSIHQSCMLFPFFKYDDVLDSTWRFDNILDHATDFLVNNRLSKYSISKLWCCYTTLLEDSIAA